MTEEFNETRLQRWMRIPHFTCPRCGVKSWNRDDLIHLHCGRCKEFFKQPRSEPVPHRSEPVRHNDDESTWPTFPTSTWDPPTTPDPPAFEPGGGSSGGGGASGDY